MEKSQNPVRRKERIAMKEPSPMKQKQSARRNGCRGCGAALRSGLKTCHWCSQPTGKPARKNSKAKGPRIISLPTIEADTADAGNPFEGETVVDETELLRIIAVKRVHDAYRAVNRWRVARDKP